MPEDKTIHATHRGYHGLGYSYRHTKKRTKIGRGLYETAIDQDQKSTWPTPGCLSQ